MSEFERRAREWTKLAARKGVDLTPAFDLFRRGIKIKAMSEADALEAMTQAVETLDLPDAEGIAAMEQLAEEQIKRGLS